MRCRHLKHIYCTFAGLSCRVMLQTSNGAKPLHDLRLVLGVRGDGRGKGKKGALRRGSKTILKGRIHHALEADTKAAPNSGSPPTFQATRTWGPQSRTKEREGREREGGTEGMQQGEGEHTGGRGGRANEQGAGNSADRLAQAATRANGSENSPTTPQRHRHPRHPRQQHHTPCLSNERMAGIGPHPGSQLDPVTRAKYVWGCVWMNDVTSKGLNPNRRWEMLRPREPDRKSKRSADTTSPTSYALLIYMLRATVPLARNERSTCYRRPW